MSSGRLLLFSRKASKVVPMRLYFLAATLLDVLQEHFGSRDPSRLTSVPISLAAALPHKEPLI